MSRQFGNQRFLKPKGLLPSVCLFLSCVPSESDGASPPTPSPRHPIAPSRTSVHSHPNAHSCLCPARVSEPQLQRHPPSLWGASDPGGCLLLDGRASWPTLPAPLPEAVPAFLPSKFTPDFIPHLHQKRDILKQLVSPLQRAIWHQP